MRSGVAVAALVSVLLGGCAARHARPAEQPKNAAACEPQTPRSRWREMTWPEYYRAVEQRAWRNGGRVIWIDPPLVDKVPRSELAPVAAGCAP